ncbi:MAG: diacylglycerol kinase family protein [Candidatus Delongbacteria bacterium]|nr:diacylglycerol kinase family protein [Candidatus Delongbacteria bacterium]
MIYFIFNKVSGTYTSEREELIRKHSELLFKDQFVIKYTKPFNDEFIPDITPNHISHDDSIVAVGGDGTISLCLQFIHDNDLSDKVSLGFIPAGTGNNMVKISNLSKNILTALDIINKRKIKVLQYGTINDKKVFLNFSLGFTSYVLQNRKTKTLKGYVIDGIRNYMKFKHSRTRITSENYKIDAKLFAAFFMNTTHYLSFIRFLKKNNTTDNIHIFYLPKANKLFNFIKLLPIFIGVNFFERLTLNNFSIELTKDQSIEIDGDVFRSNEKILSIKNQNKIKFISG